MVSAGRVGRYALVKMIGRGGMADVWIGKVQGANGFEKVVAIKLLAPDQVDKEEYQRALTDEARIQVHLKHPNIVDVYDLNFEAENPYMVMEYVEGIELREVLKALRNARSILPRSLSGFIVIEIAKALAYAHERRNPETDEPLNIIHRDVSPSNILLSINGDVKLSDFGIAKSSLQSAATQVGQIKGKFRYMSPEQAEGKPLDPRSDIYSLGLVFYECLLGCPAYDDPSDIGVLQMARDGSVSYPSGIDTEIKKICEKLLARGPEHRYENLKTFIRDLTGHLKSAGLASDRETLGDYLRGLNITRFRDVMSAKAAAEQWLPEATAQILDQTGRIVTLAEEMPDAAKKGRRIAWGAGVLAAVAGVSILSWMAMKEHPEARPLMPSENQARAAPSEDKPPVFGKLNIEADPPGGLLKIRYGDVTLSKPAPAFVNDIPLNVPIEVTASKKGFQNATQKLTLTAEKSSEDLKFSLKEAQGVQVSFNAEPYAEVTVPGIFSNLETPLSRTIPSGEFTVTFRHSATGKAASARLNGTPGAAYVCSADMMVSDPNVSASASCRAR